jgi:glutathione S-transferase
MVLKLYGLAISTFTQLVIMVLKETDTPYELIDVDFFAGAHEEPAYLEKQPFGQLPYIVRTRWPVAAHPLSYMA